MDHAHDCCPGQEGLRARGAPATAGSPKSGAHGSAQPKFVPGQVVRGPHEATKCDLFLASKEYRLFTLTLVSVVPVHGLLLALPYALDKCGWWEDPARRIAHCAFALWAGLQFLYNFASAQRMDPGSTTGIKPPQEATGQFEVLVTVDGMDESVRYAPNFCAVCQRWKPPRSHHCSACKRCVLRMDHHCPFLGNCVGARNHGHVLLMYLFALIGLIYSLGVCIYAVRRSWTRRDYTTLLKRYKPVRKNRGGGNSFMPDGFNPLAGFNPNLIMAMYVEKVIGFPRHLYECAGLPVLLQIIFSAIAFICCALVAIDSWASACSGSTALEYIYPKKEMVQAGPDDYYPLDYDFYQMRMLQNLREVLGSSWWRRLLLPLRGLDLGYTTPRAGFGGRALAKRIMEVRSRVAHEGIAVEG